MVAMGAVDDAEVCTARIHLIAILLRRTLRSNALPWAAHIAKKKKKERKKKRFLPSLGKMSGTYDAN